MSIMCRHLPDKRSGGLANFVKPYIRKYVSQANKTASDIRYSTNEKVAGPAKVLPGLSGRFCS